MKFKIFIPVLIFLASCSGESQPVNENRDTVITDSLVWFNKKVSAEPNNKFLLFERAKFFVRKGDADQAQLDLEKYLSLDSSNLEVHKLYADIMMAKLNLEKSKYHFDFIIQRDSLNAPAFAGMGKLYALLENNAAAIAYLNKSLQLDPYQSDPYFMKGMIYRSDFLQTGRTESWDLALSSFQTAIEQDPENYSAYVQLGVMYDQLGDSTAVEYYNSALDIYPESIEAWYNKGMFYQNRNRIEEALNCYRTLNDIDSTWADPYYNQGYIYLLIQENLDSAVYYMNKATELDPLYYQAFNNLGLAFEKKGDKQKAIKNYMKAVEINPDFKIAKDNLNRLQ
ncbi:MAG: tetratricopeptide repeat protein [Crocinitomicaceae bacterium]|nr:tetratricopeptide repeat protein [Crocinitomicaceae bacterium]MBK8926217.1 tetratricopeptide repeat protein [Crocinitomicaceae bacterium]